MALKKLITKSLIIQANKLIIKSFLFITSGAICFVNLGSKNNLDTFPSKKKDIVKVTVYY